MLILLPGIAINDDGNWLAHYLLVFSLQDNAGWACADCGLNQTWSLVVEATFYLALPLYALVTQYLLGGRRTSTWLQAELALLAFLSAGSMLLQFVIYDGFPPPLVGGSLLSFGLWFAIGMALALISVAIDGSERPPPLWAWLEDHPGSVWAVALISYAGLSLKLPPTPLIFDVGQQFIAFVGFAWVALLLVLPAVHRHQGSGLVPRLLALKPVSWLGLVSYGVFLWHLAVAQELRDAAGNLPSILPFALTLAITLPIASLSYYFVERPILRFKNGGLLRFARGHLPSIFGQRPAP